MLMEMSRCTEEPTKSYMKVVLTPEMGQGIMPNTVREVGEFHFWNWVGILVFASTYACRRYWSIKTLLDC